MKLPPMGPSRTSRPNPTGGGISFPLAAPVVLFLSPGSPETLVHSLRDSLAALPLEQRALALADLERVRAVLNGSDPMVDTLGIGVGLEPLKPAQADDRLANP